MSYLLFVDESGTDLKRAPFEVLAGIAIPDRQLWSLIQEVHDAEKKHFGDRLFSGTLELKGGKLLKKKTFKLASQGPTLDPTDRVSLASSCLEKGRNHSQAAPPARVTREELTALGQAKVAFAHSVLQICRQADTKVFASMVPRSAHRPPNNQYLRKDYAYLFERFFYFLEDCGDTEQGLLIFDELEQSLCHRLLDQMHRYFRGTVTGRERAKRIIPEPFFVHSEMTTAIQIADLIAYIVNWAVRFGTMPPPERPELVPLADAVMDLRHRSVRWMHQNPNFEIWSFTQIEDLRPASERDFSGDE